MKAELIQIVTLEGIPSASALSKVGGLLWVAGDDSPFLFAINPKTGVQVKALRLFDGAGPRIPKAEKPDLECMALLGQEDGLLLFGSGSKVPQRSKVVYWPTSGVPQVIQAEGWYLELMKACGVGPEDFNLEGAACHGWELLLFNRGGNQVIRLHAQELLSHLLNRGSMPELQVFQVDLGQKSGFPIGFSGASHLDANRILFSASVEATDNWIDDGEVLGSFVGLLEWGGDAGFRVKMTPVTRGGEPYKGKIEAVELAEDLSEDRFLLWAVTDDDQGGSDLLTIVLEL
jgi:hypothetical protein